MARRQKIEDALGSWRDAVRREARAVDGDRASLTHDVEVSRDEFQRLSTEHMTEWITKLQEAEARRANATPSTLPFHEAARDTEVIAADTPQTAENQRRPSDSGEATRDPGAAA